MRGSILTVTCLVLLISIAPNVSAEPTTAEEWNNLPDHYKSGFAFGFLKFIEYYAPTDPKHVDSVVDIMNAFHACFLRNKLTASTIRMAIEVYLSSHPEDLKDDIMSASFLALKKICEP